MSTGHWSTDPRNPNIKLEYYNSLYEFVVQCRDGHSDVPISKRTSKRSNNSWGEISSLEESCDKALYGWPEGLAKIDLALAKLVSILPSVSIKREFRPSMYGYPVIGKVMTGQPTPFRRRIKVQSPSPTQRGKLVKLYYNYAVSANIGSRDKFQTGAAVVALINSLEQAGYSCELFLVNGNRCWTHNDSQIHIITCAKHADEYLSLENIAFLLCATDMDRRLAFSIMEQWSEADRKRMNVPPFGSYPGAISYFPEEAKDSNVIKIGAQSTHDTFGDYAKNPSPEAWIQAQLQHFGVELNQ